MDEKLEMSPCERFYKKQPPYSKHLRFFGEKGVVTKNPGPTIKSKLDDRGIECMFLGYAKGHAGDVYRMLNLKTRKVIISRDVQWMGAGKNETKAVRFNEDDDDDDGETVEAMEFDDEDEEIEEEEEHQNQAPNTIQAPTPKPRLINEVKGLKMYNNPGRLDLEEGNLFCFFVGAENKEKKHKNQHLFQMLGTMKTLHKN